ncbi:MAG: hypothetical protein IJ629_00320 [Clostridia bacterium]|nr:hypothetical protein [Clostridia bacterium]
METVISNDDRIAIAEVDYIIHHMNERYLSKIPQNIQDYLTILKKRNLNIYVDPHKPLERQGLKEFTLYFLMILNLKYWCDDARRKDILLMLEDNQKKYEAKINNIFDNAQSIQGDSGASSRPINRPRQVIVTGTPTFPSRGENKEVVHDVAAPASTGQVEVNNTVKENAIDNLAKETDAIMNVKAENFFTKFINKIKGFLIRK